MREITTPFHAAWRAKPAEDNSLLEFKLLIFILRVKFTSERNYEIILESLLGN